MQLPTPPYVSPPYFLFLDLINCCNIWRGLEILKLLIRKFLPVPGYLLLPRPLYGHGPEPVSSNFLTGSYQCFHELETFWELLTKGRQVITHSEDEYSGRLCYCMQTVLVINPYRTNVENRVSS